VRCPSIPIEGGRVRRQPWASRVRSDVSWRQTQHPIARHPAAGLSLLSVVGVIAAALWCLIGSAGQSSWSVVSLAAPLPILRSDLIHRPGDGTLLRAPLPAPEAVDFSFYYGAAAAFAASNGVPSTSIRCRITASLRAKATLALRIPARLAMPRAHLRRGESPFERSTMALAAS